MSDDLPASKLGTKDYWEEAYARELQVNEEMEHAADGESQPDPGEIWFGKSTQKRVLVWITSTLLPRLAEQGLDTAQPIRFIDVGCGNAMAIVTLAKKYSDKWEGGWQFVGIDYSQNAIALAQRVLQQQLGEQYNTDSQHFKLFVVDFLRDQLPEEAGGPFHVVFDKGTFDAISLSQEGQTNKQLYLDSLKRILHPTNGIFVITSCNFTQDELVTFFQGHGGLRKVGYLNFPQIQFGGKTGSTYSTVAFCMESQTC